MYVCEACEQETLDLFPVTRPDGITIKLGGCCLPPEDEPWHGTPGGYNNYSCRCGYCRWAWRRYRKDRRGKGLDSTR